MYNLIRSKHNIVPTFTEAQFKAKIQGFLWILRGTNNSHASTNFAHLRNCLHALHLSFLIHKQNSFEEIGLFSLFAVLYVIGKLWRFVIIKILPEPPLAICYFMVKWSFKCRKISKVLRLDGGTVQWRWWNGKSSEPFNGEASQTSFQITITWESKMVK